MKRNLLNLVFLFFCALTTTFAQTNVALSSNGATIITEGFPAMDDGWTNNGGTYYPVTNAIDGNSVDNDNRWIWRFATGGTNPNGVLPVSVIIDFGASYDIDSFKFIEGNNTSKTFTIQYSNGGSAFAEAYSATENPDVANTPNETIDTFSTVTADQVKITWSEHNNASFIRMYEIEIYGTLSTSINDFESKTFSVYPNPVQGDYLTIKSDDPVISASIYDVLGKRINSSLSGKEVNISNMLPGVYFMKVNDTQLVKFVKE